MSDTMRAMNMGEWPHRDPHPAFQPPTKPIEPINMTEFKKGDIFTDGTFSLERDKRGAWYGPDMMLNDDAIRHLLSRNVGTVTPPSQVPVVYERTAIICAAKDATLIPRLPVELAGKETLTVLKEAIVMDESLQHDATLAFTDTTAWGGGNRKLKAGDRILVVRLEP